MDALGALFDILLWLFGYVEDQKEIQKECAALMSSQVAVYPLSAEEYERLEKCKSQQE